ncbi:hypothetical protein [Streptomyces sp. NPDC053726]|uniref:hypothetical protein n=1 Tax=Streptomyces sp. NPDC053726 TaxID=3365713 RepID=UPI0037CD0D9D
MASEYYEKCTKQVQMAWSNLVMRVAIMQLGVPLTWHVPHWSPEVARFFIEGRSQGCRNISKLVHVTACEPSGVICHGGA